LFALAAAVAGLISWPLEPAQLPHTVFLATIVLFDLAIVSVVLFGSNLGWLIPGVVALACSTPGLVPLRYNWLVSASNAHQLTAVGVLLGVVAAASYVTLDEYGLRRQTRLVERRSVAAAD
jgi:hypothetical protein